MAYTPKTITDRVIQYPKRYKLKNVSTGTDLGTFDLEAITGTITSAGTLINKTYLQDLENNLGQAIQNGDTIDGGTF